ncbi:hypothetical protein [Streptomyces lycii]|nr:hypothetical protein [Streptomyces lycii]
MNIALLLAAGTATAAGAATLYASHGLRKQVTALRAELAADRDAPAPGSGSVPAARETPAEEIRAAVADALAEERERELAEARAFWAAQEARDAADTPSLLGGLAGFGDDTTVFLPRQADFAGLEPLLDAADLEIPGDEDEDPETVEIDEPADSPELAAARRRHPSHPDFTPQTSAIANHERTISLLTELAEDCIPLSDVRPGPLGTLDVYVFADGTTVCMTPGHRETAEQLAQALRDGTVPVLLGGSGVSGAYALTFACGEESIYVLADRVIASL